MNKFNKILNMTSAGSTNVSNDQPCPDCGDLGWVYSEDFTKRWVCPCHY